MLRHMFHRLVAEKSRIRVVPFSRLGECPGVPFSTVSTGLHSITPPSLDGAIAAFATEQYAIVTRWQLEVAGLRDSAISKRVARGVLHRVHRGVYAVVPPAALTREGHWLAATLAGGPGSALSRYSATELHGVTRERGCMISVVTTSQRRPAGVTVHRCRSIDPRDLTTHKGIPVTTVHRTIVDLADVVQIPHELTAVIHEAAFKGRFVEAAVRDVMARVNGRKNLHVVDRAIALHRAGSAGIRSRGELAFFLLVTAAGWPEPLVNVHAHGFERDFHWPGLRLAVEIDGPGHGRPPTRDADASRDGTLTAAGYSVLRFSDHDVRFRPADVLTRLRMQAPHGPAR
jgi:hypothetical protein